MRKIVLASVFAVMLVVPAGAEHLPARGSHGAVASAEVHATQAGIDVLKAGGNAVDAAVAVGFALAVTHSSAGNIGGGGFMLVRQADGKSYFVDFREEAPGKATTTMYQDAQGNIVKGRSTVGMLASGIPGTVAGLTSAQQRLGKLTLAQDMAPAIRLAADGFPLDTQEAGGFRRARNLAQFPDSRRVFQRDGQFYEVGEIFKQPELAATLKLIASDGGDAFYKGRIAHDLAAFEAANGGLITLDDLAHYQAKWREPLAASYHGYDILTSPPPSSGGVAIVEMLNMLEHSNFVQAGMDSAAALHDEIEAQRRAMADRAVYLADPDFVKVPVATLISPEYAKERWASVKPDAASSSKEVGAGPVPGWESTETTHFSVVDEAGNAVAVTYTLNFGYGSGVTAGHLGFLLNDEMDDFTSKPGAPNGFNLIQGKANDIQPYKRPLSSMVPTIVSRDGKLALVLGSPGGPRIITSVFEVLTGVLDFGLDVQQAVDAPRFHQQWMPEEVYLEGPSRFSPDTLKLLEKMGYPLKVGGAWCDVEAIQIDSKTGMRMAATDPRADGAAIAY
ncbi:MAG TPA: gamma-glutamyltransferase [Vicinamibacterales bacterium]|nr:gamma-glutamyltransferase [Vicinamibacterales bacterium]